LLFPPVISIWIDKKVTLPWLPQYIELLAPED
jgi:hypothetical protein